MPTVDTNTRPNQQRKKLVKHHAFDYESGWITADFIFLWARRLIVSRIK